MSQPTPTPNLTPSFCFHPSALRLFLRSSRSMIDDPINTSLNTLLTPSTSPSTPSPFGTTTRTGPTPHTLPQSLCTTYLNQVLFASWHARSQVLTYCASVATSPDPDDPEAVEREVYNRRGQERVVDERLDPYSGRFFPKEARTEELARVLRQEEGIERIVRGRSWGVVRGRCEGMDVGGSPEAWEPQFERWRRTTIWADGKP